MQEMLNASAPQPSPSKPSLTTGNSSYISSRIGPIICGSSRETNHPFAPNGYASQTLSGPTHSPKDGTAFSTTSSTSSSFKTAETEPRYDLADVSGESDWPLAIVRQKLAMQFPLPPASPATTEHGPFASAQAEALGADSVSKRRKRLSVSAVEELKRVLGTDVELESIEGGHTSPHLAYDLATPILPLLEESFSVHSKPSSFASVRRSIGRSGEGAVMPPSRARCPPTIPLPPPPSHAQNSASKRHAVSIQLPSKTLNRTRSSTATSLPSEDCSLGKAATLVQRPRLPNRKVSITFPSNRPSHEGEPGLRPSSARPEAQLRVALDHQRVQLDAVTRELKAVRAAHAEERAVLLARIDTLEREVRRRERVAAAPAMTLGAFATHLRAGSAGTIGSQYSIESVVAVASELAGFLHAQPPTPAMYRRSVLGIPDEQSPDLRVHDHPSDRRKSSPVILCTHFPPLNDVLGAVDPLAALIAADGIGPSASLPSLSSSSTVCSMLSSIEESPNLPDHPPVLVQKPPPVGFRSMISQGKLVVVEDGENLPDEWAAAVDQ